MTQILSSLLMSLVMSLFSSLGGLIGALPHTILPGARPVSVVEDAAQVLEIYRGIAAANDDTELTKSMRVTDYPSITGIGSSRIRSAVDLAFALADTKQAGVPGNPSAIKAGDLKSAKAEYYNLGLTVVITLVPKEQTDAFDGQANEGPVGRSIGVLGTTVQKPLEVISAFGIPLSSLQSVVKVKYLEPSITVKASARTGKIITAEYSYKLVMEMPLRLFPNLRLGADYSISKTLI